MDLYLEIKKMWEESDADATSARWATAADKAIPGVRSASTTFHRWQPLRFYVALSTMTRRTGVVFSVRFSGQEVAEVHVAGTEPKLVVSDDHEAHNREYFHCDTPAGTHRWTGSAAAQFREAFGELAGSGRPFKIRSPEHSLEARILKEMEGNKGRKKFGGTLKNIRHVGVTQREYPFQCPVPLSASSGKPKKGRGNVDILARRGPGKPHLSVWELKAPGKLDHAVAQAYIYSVELALMLRGTVGEKWWRLFGYHSPLPKLSSPSPLRIETVAAVTKDRYDGVRAQADRLRDSFFLQDENVQLELYAAIYDEELNVNYKPLT